MKFLFFIFLFIILVMNTIIAVGFSPSSLTFELEQNVESCQIITLSSDSDMIGVSDEWAENEGVEWKVSLFDKDASEHGISISYDSELDVDEREVEVCLSGSEVGEYHGVILLKEEQQGNSIIQMGVWLKVIISEGIQEETPENNQDSSGGGLVTSILNNLDKLDEEKENESEEIEEEQEIEEIGNIDEEERDSQITGAVIGGGNKSLTIISIIVVLVIVGAFYIYKTKRTVKGDEGGEVGGEKGGRVEEYKEDKDNQDKIGERGARI